MFSQALREKFNLIKERTLDNLVVDSKTAEVRYDTCIQCDRFNNLSKMCKECGCFMPAKVKLKAVVCPLKKW